jgi:hypothetical protein
MELRQTRYFAAVAEELARFPTTLASLCRIKPELSFRD